MAENWENTLEVAMAKYLAGEIAVKGLPGCNGKYSAPMDILQNILSQDITGTPPHTSLWKDQQMFAR